MSVHVEIPQSIVEAMRLPEREVSEQVRLELGLALYARGVLSRGKARELSGLDQRAFARLLGQRGIDRHYEQDELEEDLTYARGE